MICTNDYEAYEKLRMLRSHGMVREASKDEFKQKYVDDNPSLNTKFIFAFPSYNVRNNEIGGVIGLSQLKRLDKIIKSRNDNFFYFLNNLKKDIFFTDFIVEGCSNYAFNLILKNPDDDLMIKIMNNLDENGIEYRKGSAGGGNQLRQPYLKGMFPENFYKKFPNTEHVHFYGMYIGNYPELSRESIDYILSKINI